MDSVYDLIVVGDGPVGLSTAIYAGRSERRTLLLEKGSYDGKINDTYEIRNYPGTKAGNGQHLMGLLREHVAGHPTVELKHITVTGVRKEDDTFIVETKRRGDLTARNVILDLGTRPRELNIKGGKEFTGHGVAYCAAYDAESFRGKEVYMLGAGDQAIEESDYLTGFASKVTIVALHEERHLNRNEVAAEHAYKDPKIDLVWGSTIQKIKESDHMKSLVLKNVDTGRETEAKADGLFLFAGMVPQTGLVKDMVDYDKAGYVKVNEKMETNVPGLYAAGDCIQTFPRQVVTLTVDDAMAAAALERYVKELEQIQETLEPDSGRTVFLFYNPYSNEETEKTAQLEQELNGQRKIYRQDVTRQSLLYSDLKLERTVTEAFCDNGKLVGIRQAF